MSLDAARPRADGAVGGAPGVTGAKLEGPNQSDVSTQAEVGLSATHALPEQVWHAPQSALPVHAPPTQVFVVASQVSPAPVQSAAWVATVQ